MKKSLVGMIALVGVLWAWTSMAWAADEVNCWFPPEWKGRIEQSEKIAKALSDGSGLRIIPKVAGSYTDILKAFSSGDKSIVYAGSFVSAIIYARGIGVPLVHLQDGMEFYAGVLVYPEKENPASLLKDHPEEIAYAVGTSAGEVSAKAATDGKAKVGVSSHGAAISSVVSGKARAAVVKDWWWEGNRSNHPGLAIYAIPDISIDKLPDNLLTTSVSIPEPIRLKLAVAAVKHMDVFGASGVDAFDPSDLTFTLSLMGRANINPFTYSW